YSYKLTTVNGSMLDPQYLLETLKINPVDIGYDRDNYIYYFHALTGENVEILKSNPQVKSIEKMKSESEGARIFPHSKPDWNVDNMGPIYIPEAGKTVELNTETLPFYKTIISVYEGNDLKVNGIEILI